MTSTLVADDDHARPCTVDGCRLPGRFVLGLDQGTTTCWCIRHIAPDGVAWLIALAEGVRNVLPPGLIEQIERDVNGR